MVTILFVKMCTQYWIYPFWGNLWQSLVHYMEIITVSFYPQQELSILSQRHNHIGDKSIINISSSVWKSSQACFLLFCRMRWRGWQRTMRSWRKLWVWRKRNCMHWRQQWRTSIRKVNALCPSLFLCTCIFLSVHPSFFFLKSSFPPSFFHILVSFPLLSPSFSVCLSSFSSSIFCWWSYYNGNSVWNINIWYMILMKY